MALIQCSECGLQISDKAPACVGCGAPVTPVVAAAPPQAYGGGPKPSPPPEASKGLNWWIWAPGGLVVAFLGYGYSVSNTPEGQARSRDRQAISYCWSEQERKSLTPGSQRLVAGACELMENEFRNRHGVSP